MVDEMQMEAANTPSCKSQTSCFSFHGRFQTGIMIIKSAICKRHRLRFINPLTLREGAMDGLLKPRFSKECGVFVFLPLVPAKGIFVALPASHPKGKGH